jgi:hypothetical protein
MKLKPISDYFQGCYSFGFFGTIKNHKFSAGVEDEVLMSHRIRGRHGRKFCAFRVFGEPII